MAEAANSGTAAPDGGDNRSHSMNRSLEIRKKIVKHSSDCRRRSPLLQLAFNYDGIPTHDTLEYVELALSYFNEKNRPQQDPEYELVDSTLGIVHQTKPSIYHFNFIARPKNQSEAKDELFFAEVSFARKEDGKVGPLCCCCCILGPPGTETGLGGCNLCCKRHPGLIQHPEDGFSKDTD